MRVHVPFGGAKKILNILARREIPLVIFERLDHQSPVSRPGYPRFSARAWMRGIMSAYPFGVE